MPLSSLSKSLKMWIDSRSYRVGSLTRFLFSFSPKGVTVLGLTKGEKKALIFMFLAIIGFMPPVTTWANRVEPFVMGMPFLLFWQGFMIFGTFVCMAIAYFVKEGADKK